MTNAPRRKAHQVPGENLLLDENILAAPARAREFSEDTGVPFADLVVSPLAATAIPVDTYGEDSRRWAGTRPEAMWHPLMWLPSRLSSRYRYKNREGEVVFENDDQWAARVVMELTAAGLYDPETGEWVDVLATFGIDVDDDLDLARIEDWLDGEPDEVLDTIDLDEAVRNVHDETWALVSVLVLEDILWQASWAMVSNSLIELLDMAFITDPERVMLATRTASTLGMALLGEVRGDDYPVMPSAVFGDIFMRSSKITHEDPDATPCVNELFNILYTIRESHWPALEALHEAHEDAESELLEGANGRP